ncbi:MAG: DUF7144 family membrane protein [Acidimicrobiales bacterium]
MGKKEGSTSGTRYVEPPGSGWRAFAGTLILLGGVFNLLDGVVALTYKSYLSNHLLWSNFATWGWILVVFGLLQVLAGLLIFRGSTWAAAFGIVLVSLNTVGQLAFLRSYPVWSVIIIAVDLMVIYGLTAYGSTRREMNT